MGRPFIKNNMYKGVISMQKVRISIKITYFNESIETIIMPKDYLWCFVETLVNCETIIKVEIEEL